MIAVVAVLVTETKFVAVVASLLFESVSTPETDIGPAAVAISPAPEMVKLLYGVTVFGAVAVVEKTG